MPTDIYTLSLHDALPISSPSCRRIQQPAAGLSIRRSRRLPAPMRPGATQDDWAGAALRVFSRARPPRSWTRSEEHTSELQSHVNLVCRLLLEKKKKKKPA